MVVHSGVGGGCLFTYCLCVSFCKFSFGVVVPIVHVIYFMWFVLHVYSFVFVVPIAHVFYR